MLMILSQQELVNYLIWKDNFESDGLLHQSQINSSKKMNCFCHWQGKVKLWDYIQLLEKFHVYLEQRSKWIYFFQLWILLKLKTDQVFLMKR